MNTSRKICLAGTGALALASLTGCHIDMWRQNKVLPQQESDFFADRQGSRHLPPHTVARTNGFGVPGANDVQTGNPLYTGFEGTKLVKTIPTAALNAFGGSRLAMIRRGQERFNIYCSPCHSRIGDGNGMIAQRGFNLRRKPANYHTDKVRNLPDGHYFDVITHGFGVMYSYADRVDPVDRWAIVSYIRTLQYSQNAPAADVPPEKTALLDGPPAAPQPAMGSESAP